MNFLEKNKGFLLNKKLDEVRGGLTTYLCKLFVAELRSQTSFYHDIIKL